jgi:hypothetical protein
MWDGKGHYFMCINASGQDGTNPNLLYILEIMDSNHMGDRPIVVRGDGVGMPRT